LPDNHSDPAQTEMQAGLTGAARGGLKGLFAKYRDIFLGRSPLLLYELASTLAQNAGGAVGFMLRKQLYSRLLGRCGRGVVFGKGVVLRHPDRIWIGDSVIIDDNVVLDAKGPDGDAPNIVIGDGVFIGRNTILSCKGGTIELGDNTNIGANCQIQSESSCKVGANVLFASYCYIVAGGNHGIDRVDIPPIQQKPVSRGGVRICDGVWLGANVKVIDGVEMGRDSIAAAGATVIRSCGGWDIVGGVPAKVIRNRLEDAKKEGKSLPSDADPRRLTPPTRHDSMPPSEEPRPRKSPVRVVIGSAVKLALSALLVWYLVSLQAGPAHGTFDSIDVGRSSRAEIEADPVEAVPPASLSERIATRLRAMASMKGSRRKLLPLKAGEKKVSVIYCMAVKDEKGGWTPDEAGPLLEVRYDEAGIAVEKRWERGFWASVWEQVKGFLRYWPWFLFAGCFHFTGYLVTSWNWRQSMAVQGKAVRFWPLMGSNIIAGLFNNILPTNIGGDVVRIRDSAIAVFGSEGKPDFVRAGTVVVIQRVIGVFALVLIAVAAVAARAGGSLGEGLASSVWTFVAAVAAAGILAAVILHPRMLSLIAAFFDLFRGLPIAGTLASKFLVVLETAAKYREQRAMLMRIFLTSLLLQLNVVAYYYVCTKAIGYEAAFVSVFAAAPLVVILMTIVPSINGVGVRDWGFMKLLGMSPAVAIAFSLMDVVWRLAWGVLGGVFLALRGAVKPGCWLMETPAAGGSVAEGRP
jgi:acetyltransferase-like isoleucine patch superfamily enzyme/uncharacterized membrane protein YbhN (UPF0104 family)